MNDGCVEFWRNFKKAFNLSDAEIWAVIENRPLNETPDVLADENKGV